MGDSEGDLRFQLNALRRRTQEIRMRTRSELDFRPRRVIMVLWKRGGAKDIEESWHERLREWECQNGAIWKFGPMPMLDGNALHAAFTEVASTMLARAFLDKTSVSCQSFIQSRKLMESWGDEGLLKSTTSKSIWSNCSSAESDEGAKEGRRGSWVDKVLNFSPVRRSSGRRDSLEN